MKNPNIEVKYKNGEVDLYITKSSDDLSIPMLGFKKEEDAELAVAIAKALDVRGENCYANFQHLIKYTFRLLGLKDSGWVE